MNAATTLKKLGIEQTFNFIYKDPDKNMPKLMDWADKFAKGEFPSQRKAIREAITDPDHPYYSYIRRLFKEVDPNVTRTLAVNLFINASLVGWPKEEECRRKYGCNIPWAILLDPTSACNLRRRPLYRPSISGKCRASVFQVRPIRSPLETGRR